MFRLSRQRTEGDDRFLAWRVRLFMIGAPVAFAGMAASLKWLVWVGIAVLVAAMVLRFLPARD